MRRMAWAIFTVTVPETELPAEGAVTATVGAALSTVTVTAAEVVELPAASLALAVITSWSPSPATPKAMTTSFPSPKRLTI